MIKEIPEEEEELMTNMKEELESALYTAPENMHLKWNNVQSIITEKFNGHKNMSTLPEWGVKMIEIWTNKTMKE